MPPLPVHIWQAFRAEGAGVRITAKTSAGKLVLALVTDGQPFASMAMLSPPPPPLVTSRVNLVTTVDVSGVDDLAFANDSSHVRILFEDGRASMQLMMMSKDAPVPRHKHPSSWEVMGLFTADGTFTVAGEDVQARSGSILNVAPATDHQWTPAGKIPLIGVQLYVPPGPEQRFKTMAAK